MEYSRPQGGCDRPPGAAPVDRKEGEKTSVTAPAEDSIIGKRVSIPVSIPISRTYRSRMRVVTSPRPLTHSPKLAVYQLETEPISPAQPRTESRVNRAIAQELSARRDAVSATLAVPPRSAWFRETTTPTDRGFHLPVPPVCLPRAGGQRLTPSFGYPQMVFTPNPNEDTRRRELASLCTRMDMLRELENHHRHVLMVTSQQIRINQDDYNRLTEDSVKTSDRPVQDPLGSLDG